MTTDKRNEKSSPIRPRKLSDNKKYPPIRQSKEVILACFAGHQRDHFLQYYKFFKWNINLLFGSISNVQTRSEFKYTIVYL